MTNELESKPTEAELIALREEIDRLRGNGDLRDSLRLAINRHSAENGSNTADSILAEYLVACLAAFDRGVLRREAWSGHHHGVAGQTWSPKDDRRLLDKAMEMSTTCTYSLEYEDPLFVRDLGAACCAITRINPSFTSTVLPSTHERVFALVPETADPSFEPAFICVTVVFRAGDLPPWPVRVIVDLSCNEILPWDFSLNPHKCVLDLPDTLIYTSAIPPSFLGSTYSTMKQDGMYSFVPADELLEFIKQNI